MCAPPTRRRISRNHSHPNLANLTAHPSVPRLSSRTPDRRPLRCEADLLGGDGETAAGGVQRSDGLARMAHALPLERVSHPALGPREHHGGARANTARIARDAGPSPRGCNSTARQHAVLQHERAHAAHAAAQRAERAVHDRHRRTAQRRRRRRSRTSCRSCATSACCRRCAARSRARCSPSGRAARRTRGSPAARPAAPPRVPLAARGGCPPRSSAAGGVGGAVGAAHIVLLGGSRAPPPRERALRDDGAVARGGQRPARQDQRRSARGGARARDGGAIRRLRGADVACHGRAASAPARPPPPRRHRGAAAALAGALAPWRGDGAVAGRRTTADAATPRLAPRAPGCARVPPPPLRGACR